MRFYDSNDMQFSGQFFAASFKRFLLYSFISATSTKPTAFILNISGHNSTQISQSTQSDKFIVGLFISL